MALWCIRQRDQRLKRQEFRPSSLIKVRIQRCCFLVLFRYTFSLITIFDTREIKFPAISRDARRQTRSKENFLLLQVEGELQREYLQWLFTTFVTLGAKLSGNKLSPLTLTDARMCGRRSVNKNSAKGNCGGREHASSEDKWTNQSGRKTLCSAASSIKFMNQRFQR